MSFSDRPVSGSDAQALNRRSARGGALTFGAQGLRFVLKLAAQIVIARFLLPADYGLIAMVAPVLALVQLLSDFGIAQTVVQRPDLEQKDVSILFWLGLALNIALAGALALASPFIAWLYHEPRLQLVSIALAVLIPISGLATLPAALLTRDMRFAPLAVLASSRPPWDSQRASPPPGPA